MGWKVIKDHTWKPGDLEKWGIASREGRTADYHGGEMQVRTWDDDGVLMYTTLCDDEESAEWFHDWSTNDVGSVRSQIRKKGNQKWEEFIS